MGIDYNNKEMRKQECQKQHTYINELFREVVKKNNLNPKTWGDVRNVLITKYAGISYVGDMLHFFDSVLEIKKTLEWEFVSHFLYAWREACFLIISGRKNEIKSVKEIYKNSKYEHLLKIT